MASRIQKSFSINSLQSAGASAHVEGAAGGSVAARVNDVVSPLIPAAASATSLRSLSESGSLSPMNRSVTPPLAASPAPAVDEEYEKLFSDAKKGKVEEVINRISNLALSELQKEKIDIGLDTLEMRQEIITQKLMKKAVNEGDLKAIITLAKSGGNLNTAEKYEFILKAAQKGDLEDVKTLMKAGSDLTAAEKDELLIKAAQTGDLKAVRTLMKAGLDVKAAMGKALKEKNSLAFRTLRSAKRVGSLVTLAENKDISGIRKKICGIAIYSVKDAVRDCKKQKDYDPEAYRARYKVVGNDILKGELLEAEKFQQVKSIVDAVFSEVSDTGYLALDRAGVL